jgi:RNA polymerase sigma factor (sigma-70 family)
MQDWPTYDRDIVAAIVARDPAGLAAAYDRYALALYTYCRSLLAEPADAADAVQDTFVVASTKLDGLRDPDRLRAWLYAVARNECHRRLRARARMADLDEAGEMTDDSADVGEDVERDELRDLVRSAIAGLNPGEREVIELTLRHELGRRDLPAALGVPPNQAHAMVSRARTQLERSLGALLVARTGRESCPELDDILVGWGGHLTVLLRKRVSRHIENCDVCGECKRRELSPAMLLSALPVFILPAGLRQQVLRLVSDPTPDAAGYRRHVTRRAEPFGPAGFPDPISAVARLRPRGRTIAYAAAAVIVLLAGGGAAAGALLDSGGGPVNAAHTSGGGLSGPTVAGFSPSPTSSRSRVPPTRSPRLVATSSPSPTPTPAPTPTVPGVPTPTPTVTPTPTPTPTRTPTPTPTRTSSPPPTTSPTPPPQGTLQESPATVTLTQPETGGPYSGTFTLTASGGPVTFTITVPQGLIVSPSSGSLSAGQSVTITVTADAENPPPFTSTLTVDPGAVTVTVLYPPSG